MKRSMRYVGALIALSAAVGLSSCSGTTSTSSGATGTTGSTGSSTSSTIIEAVPSLPTSYAYDAGDFSYAGFELQINTNSQLIQNPIETTSGGGQQESLFKFQGELATSYDVSTDGLTYTFHLRQGVKSAQGNPLTADDVVWTYERKFSKDGGVTPFINYPAITDPAKQIKKIDASTVSFTVPATGDGFTLLALLANVSADIYDSTYLKSKASADDPYAVKWSAANGNYGFGAYDLSSFTAGQQLVLKANANYYGGAPKIQTVIQKVVADPGQRASLLANGSVDIAVQLRPSDIKSLQGNSSVSTFKGLDTVNYTNLDLNVTTGTFSKLAIRQALKYAIPYDQINTNVYNGQLTAMKGFINPRYPGADLDGLSAGTYDPAKSKSILAAAGITTPVSFTLLVNTAIPDLGQVAVQMQSAGSAAGFDIKLQNEPSAAFSDATGNHKYEAALVHDGSISQAPPYELMLAYTKDSPLNTTGWTDQAYYDLVNKGIDAGDALSAAAGKFWNQAQLEWQTQTPSIPMGFIQPLLAVRSDVKGYYYRTEQAIDFAHISKG